MVDSKSRDYITVEVLTGGWVRKVGCFAKKSSQNMDDFLVMRRVDGGIFGGGQAFAFSKFP